MIETPKYIFLIMEFAVGGELFDHIVNKGRVRDEEACRFFFLKKKDKAIGTHIV